MTIAGVKRANKPKYQKDRELPYPICQTLFVKHLKFAHQAMFEREATTQNIA